MIQNFIVVAKEATAEGQPTRRLTANTGTQENPIWVDLGVAWVKKNAKGETFLSAQLQKEDKTYKNKEGLDVNIKAYTIISVEEYNFLKNCEARVNMLTSDGKIDMAKHPLNSEAEQKRYDNELADIGF